ncbi:UNVERIFIED_ORG: undecaprenyl-diphosphatase [Xanthobacter viscosus]|uniref:Phosphatase PAP2 family protein n=1 Tax=Xanthobacter autotrophicus TaxID=280 RepID=A0A6C1KI57_XANAU|nr:phosphatase PAP2 family protein [Xanthobacter autotrophicus]TLX43481.1 phosphatase PAP2 family protein [Xanthobacter autotrophicus]
MTAEAAPGVPPSRPGTAPPLLVRQAVEGARLLLVSVGQALGYVARRRIGTPLPRLGFLGRWEMLALALFAAGLTAAALVLIDPLVLGLRFKLPGWLITVSERLTDLGFSGVVLWPLGLALAYALLLTHAGDAMTRRLAASLAARVGFLFLAIAPVGLGVSLFKHVLGRARPHAALALPGPNPEQTLHLFAFKSSFAAFPSGHSTTTFAAAVAFAALFPRARAWLIALALPVAATRVALGSHFPSDVIAGAAIGSAFALWMIRVFAARRLVFKVDGTGAIAPMAGPSARRLGRLLPRTTFSSAVPVEEARP